jgi:hypothetical protein
MDMQNSKELVFPAKLTNVTNVMLLKLVINAHLEISFIKMYVLIAAQIQLSFKMENAIYALENAKHAQLWIAAKAASTIISYMKEFVLTLVKVALLELKENV